MNKLINEQADKYRRQTCNTTYTDVEAATDRPTVCTYLWHVVRDVKVCRVAQVAEENDDLAAGGRGFPHHLGSHVELVGKVGGLDVLLVRLLRW